MTLAALASQARRYARIDTAAADSDQLDALIQDAVDKFSRDVGGFPMDVNLAISAAFDTETHFAFHVEIVEGGSETVDADVAITSTAREDADGDQVASDLQTALRAMTGATGSETVAWTDFYFTIDFDQGNTSSGDYIKLSAPSGVTYANALEILGLSAGTTTGSTSVTGGFPEDCTKYVTLPSPAVSVQRVEWDYHELDQVGYEYVQSSESTGDPTHYAIRGRRLYLVPSPDRQDRLEVWYRGLPTAIDFDSDSDVPSEVPEQYQEALTWLVAMYLCREAFDNEQGNTCRAEYNEIMRRYRMDYANLNTAIEDNYYSSYPRIPKIGSRVGFT